MDRTDTLTLLMPPPTAAQNVIGRLSLLGAADLTVLVLSFYLDLMNAHKSCMTVKCKEPVVMFSWESHNKSVSDERALQTANSMRFSGLSLSVTINSDPSFERSNGT